MKLKGSGHQFTDEYKYKMFLLWYSQGGPSQSVFYNMITPDDRGEMPARSTIPAWIVQFKSQAEIIDSQIKAEIEKRMVKEKVEMLSRHAELGKKMQDIGIDFIDDNEDGLTSATAVRLLVAGVEIERNSRGMSDALEKIMTQSDEKLLDRIKELTKNDPVEISPLT